MWVLALPLNTNPTGMTESTVQYYNTDRSRIVWRYSGDSKYYISAEPYPTILIDGSPAARQSITNDGKCVWKVGSLYLFYTVSGNNNLICDVICGPTFNDTVYHPYWVKAGSMFGTYTRVGAAGPATRVVSGSIAGFVNSATLVGVYSDGTVVGWKRIQDTSGVLLSIVPGFTDLQDTLPYINGYRRFKGQPNKPKLRLWWSIAFTPARWIVVYDPLELFVDPPPAGTSYWQSNPALGVGGLLGAYTFVLNGGSTTYGPLALSHLGYASGVQRYDAEPWHYAHGGGFVNVLGTSVTMNYR